MANFAPADGSIDGHELRDGHERPASGVEQSDLELVRRVQRGERGAFDLLVLRYQHKVVKLVARLLLNAFNPAMFRDLGQAVEAASSRADIRVVIFTGAGRAFCSGADLTNVGEYHSVAEGDEQDRRCAAELPPPGPTRDFAVSGPAEGHPRPPPYRAVACARRRPPTGAAMSEIARIIEKHSGERGSLIAILQDIQAKYSYLPEEALRRVAERTGRSLVDVYGVATFYRAFSLKPRGKHLVTCWGKFIGDETGQIENIRNAWAAKFKALTGGRGSIADVSPTVTVAIASPCNGATINRPNANVRGAYINTTGNETGITVNGVVASVYGNRFVASHVPLVEGSNTLTVTATDTAGNTSSSSVTVNVVTAENYMTVRATPDSGIAPLEVTVRVDGSFGVFNPTITVDGPGSVESLPGDDPEDYRYRLSSEGIYTFTASAAGPDGTTYTDTTHVAVLNRAALPRTTATPSANRTA